MAAQILSDQDVCFGGYKLKSALNRVAMDFGADSLDCTTFGSAGNREFTGGLKTLGFSAGGYFQQQAGVGGIDAALMDSVALENIIMTVCPQNSVPGGPAKFFKAVQASYSLGAEVGNLLSFDLTAQNNDPVGLIQGTLMLNTTGLNATGNSAIRQLAAVGATQKMYAALHVFSVAGTTPSITASVQSASTVAFTSPTTRGTFNAATAIGSQLLTINGAITDTYWRIPYTITGTAPVFGVMVSLGIK